MRASSSLLAAGVETERERDEGATLAVRHALLHVTTRRPFACVDITQLLQHEIERTRLADGIISVQTCHTTTGIMVNESEPLLLQDLEGFFERLAPASGAYAHDDMARRTVNLVPDERRNGHAHCRAAVVPTSETLSVVAGSLALGRWQRVFFVEFDGPQNRQVRLTLLGTRVDPHSRACP